MHVTCYIPEDSELRRNDIFNLPGTIGRENKDQKGLPKRVVSQLGFQHGVGYILASLGENRTVAQLF